MYQPDALANFEDEFRGYDPTLKEPYSPDKIYGKLGVAYKDSETIKTGIGKSTIHIAPWMAAKVKAIQSENTHLWPWMSDLTRDSWFHRIYVVEERGMLRGESSLIARQMFREAEIERIITKSETDRHFLARFEEAYLRAPDQATKQILKDRILAWAQDHENPEIAYLARRIVQ